MGIQHSTPVPTMDDLDYFPDINNDQYNGRYVEDKDDERRDGQ
jgi:hypothetical protein